MNIPTWVIVLFFVLLFLGFKRCSTRVINVHRLIILPGIFFFMSLRHVIEIFPKNYLAAPFYILGILMGIYLGYLHVRNRKIKANKKELLLEIPGDWTMLALILAIFCVEFIIHYIEATSISLAQSLSFVLTSMIISGIIVGITFGRNGRYFYLFLHAPHDNQVLKNH